ncbi:hypothetical protein L5515_012573 [Caenorhabditis briggsae]|uniref:Uncharacterized protein n=1 Tax=Caenorhabditis briggsae TaxID=6238 RepID=A0AAE9F1I5_CAEBR|nr:hypothetical protein L5515_012573 [Caenorhabditis briggsae]
MSESHRIEIPIEGGDFDYDEDNIQELDHFDIGEEEDPEEVTAGEAGVWQDPIETVPLSRQKRKRASKKVGRKRKGEIFHIPKRQPPRASRAKSYQQYDTFDEILEDSEQNTTVEGVEDVEEGVVVEDDEEDSDPEVIDENGEPSTSKTWRVFVRKDGTGMHFDWPIYMDTAVSLKEVVQFFSNDTAQQHFQKSEMCDSIPQEFTNTGTFIIHFEEDALMGKEEICDDGLGTWNSAQMFVRKYIIGGRNGADRPLATQKNDHNLKIVCEQFIHPGTDTRGDFIRRIYTGFDKDEHMIPYVIICYEWMGQPHPLTVYEDQNDKQQQQFEQHQTWKKCSNPDEQVPILARHAYDYNSAIAILLSSQKCQNYGKCVPQFVQECITFALDMDECGGQRSLYLDGNEWIRPSGANRFFRISYPPNQGSADQDGLNTWSIERSANASNSDIQITCRRYNGQKYSSSFGFVRKIYQLKCLETCPSEVAAHLVNRNLAIVSYSYRNTGFPTFIEQPVVVVDDHHHHHHGKLSNNNRDELLGEEVEVVTGDVIFNDEDGGAEMQRMVEIMEKKKKENGQRLMDLLARMHRFNDYCKKEGWLSTNPEIQELLQIGAILETSIQ